MLNMRSIIFSIIMLVFAATTSYGQQVKAKRFTATLAGTVVLGDVADKYNPSVYNLELPEPDGSAEQKILRRLKEQIAKNYPHKNSPRAKKTTSSVAAPEVAISFVADSFPGIPPDNYSSVSNGQKAVTVLNSNIAIHDASTGAYIQRKGLKPFSTVVGLNGMYDYRYDPKVVYDPVADRFICVMLSGIDVSNYIVLAFSQSNDPTGRWNFYLFYGNYTGDTTWFDYPAISITQNEFFLTGNKIMYDSSWQAGFRRTIIYQVRKQDGYDSSLTLNYQIWDSITYNNKNLRCLYPLNPGDSLLGPSQYFLSNRNFDLNNDTVFLVKVPDTIGSVDTILTVTPIVSATASYGAPPDARMPDTAHVLATNDGRILGGYIKGDEIQFVSESLNPANGASAVYHGIISNFSTAPVMHAQLFSIDTLDFGYPNISYGGGPGESIISFEYSGPHTFPGYGAIIYDGTNYSDMTIIRKGDSSIYAYANHEQRWGDYSGSQPDFGTPGAVWVDGIYGRKDRNYGSMVARLYNPNNTAVPVIKKSQVPDSKIYPNPTFNYVSFEFNVSKQQVFSFIIYDMQGRVVDKMMDKYCQDGKNVINFNMAPLAPGTYLLKAIGANGESIAIHTFVRQ